MNTQDIVEFVAQHLRKIGADGLCNEVVECGCGLDDLMPCGEIDNLSNCEPAKRVKCTDECEHEGGPPYDFHYEEMTCQTEE